ncbi:LTA synthase family protein [Candidatus Saccharibacteria bacterium]|nr:LTA synthase family protein [Candidatus Saccharibacteria bacterium]
MKKIKRIIGRPAAQFLFFYAAGVLLTIFLEYRYYIHNWEYTWRFVFGSPLAFLFNALLMTLAVVALWAIVRRPAIAIGMMWTFVTILTYVHINKYSSRGTPLLPEDFQLASQASSLSKFVSIDSVLRMVAAVVLFWLLVYLLDLLLQKKAKWLFWSNTQSTKWYKRRQLGKRTTTLALCALLLFALTDFARHTDGQRYTPTFLGTFFTAWNQNRNYSDNGFILGFLYNLQKLQLDEPAGYSEEVIRNLRSKYETIATEKNKERKNIADEDVSLVIILNESFFDPTVEFQGLKFSDYYRHEGGDVLPVFHQLQKKYPSGLMYSLDYGGGTANIEFETLTGLTNYWAKTVPYTALIPKAGEIPSIASMLTAKDYVSTAIHPYNNGMYKRNIALANEGFQSFISDTEMKHQERDGQSEYINDASAYAETLDILKASDKNQVLALITMQNHTPYHSWIYDNPQFKITSDTVDEERKAQIATYYQSMHNSDKYLGDFIEQLDALDKKVAVLFFGDHSAGVFDLTNSSEQKTVRDLSRVTPYFIYANFDHQFDSLKLPTTSPNCMVNTLLNKFNYQKSALYYLLDEVCTEEPILAETYLEDRGTSDAAVLKDYELITYDILSGKKYWMAN